jgi:hypothetical protein
MDPSTPQGITPETADVLDARPHHGEIEYSQGDDGDHFKAICGCGWRSRDFPIHQTAMEALAAHYRNPQAPWVEAAPEPKPQPERAK